MQSLRVLSRAVARQSLARSYHGGHNSKVMNDLPRPEGDFFALQAKRNSKYNLFLITGVTMFGTALWMCKESGLIHLNYSPPAMPADE